MKFTSEYLTIYFEKFSLRVISNIKLIFTRGIKLTTRDIHFTSWALEAAGVRIRPEGIH